MKSGMNIVCGAAAIAFSGVAAAFAQEPTLNLDKPITHGPAIPGMCVLSVEGAIGNSNVGKYVQTRLQQLVAQVNAELNTEKDAIEKDSKALDSQRASLSQEAFEIRAAQIQTRAQALQRKAQLRDREMQATEQKAINRVGEEMEPLIRDAYQAQQCAMLVNRQAILLASPAADLTPAVVAALNAKISRIDFTREQL